MLIFVLVAMVAIIILLSIVLIRVINKKFKNQKNTSVI